MKRVLENDDDQRVHEWSLYFDNIVEELKERIVKFFSSDVDFEKEKNYFTKTFKKTKSFPITFMADWTAPSHASPIVNGHRVKMGYETYALFNKFMKSFLLDLGDKLITFIEFEDWKMERNIVSRNSTNSSVTLIIESKSIKDFTE